nr:hypothetical protein [Nanoarchaeum sp.]
MKTFIVNRHFVFCAIVLFVFFVVYFKMGLNFTTFPEYFKTDNIFFDADHLDNSLIHYGPNQYTTEKHPLIFFFNPLFVILISKFIPSTLVASIFVNSFYGALGVVLTFICFKILIKKTFEASLFCIIFGLSMSQIIYSSIPETYALSVCSIIPTYILFLICLERKKLLFTYWILCGVLSFGVIWVNFVPTIILFIITLIALKVNRKTIYLLRYLGLLALCIFVLRFLQKLLFATDLFPRMNVYWDLFCDEIQLWVFHNPLMIIKEIFKQFFILNFIGPFPEIIRDGPNIRMTYTRNPLVYNYTGYIGLIVWMLFFIVQIYRKCVARERNYFFIGCVCIVVFYMIFHSFYGVKEIFLYNSLFTFTVLLLVTDRVNSKNKYLNIFAISIIFFMGINNLIVIKKILSIK